MSITDIRDDALSQFSTYLYNGQPVPSGSCEAITADFIAALACANECERENLGCTPADATLSRLDAWGESLCVSRLPPTFANGTVTVYGSPGDVVPVGTSFTRCGDIAFKSEDFTTIGASGAATVTVNACEIGTDSNTPAGYALTWAGGDAISGTITGGSCIEEDAAYRRRVVQALKDKTCRTDCGTYEGYALQYPGVTRVCCEPNANGPGTIKLYALMDGTYPNGIPAPSDIVAIQDLVFGNPQGSGLAGIGPVGQVCAPTLCPVNITMNGLTTLPERAAIQATLSDYFATFTKPGEAVCRPDLEVAIAGLTARCVRIASPEAQQCGPGQIPSLGTISW